MKLYYHAVATACRPTVWFAQEHELDLSFQVVDLFSEERLGDRFAELNPNRSYRSCRTAISA